MHETMVVVNICYIRIHQTYTSTCVWIHFYMLSCDLHHHMAVHKTDMNSNKHVYKSILNLVECQASIWTGWFADGSDGSRICVVYLRQGVSDAATDCPLTSYLANLSLLCFIIDHRISLLMYLRPGAKFSRLF